MEKVNDITLAYKKQKPGQTILKIIDYDHKNIYVILSVPSNRIKEADKWMDGMFTMDKDSLKILGGFNPMKNDPAAFFSLPESATIYTKEGYHSKFEQRI